MCRLSLMILHVSLLIYAMCYSASLLSCSFANLPYIFLRYRGLPFLCFFAFIPTSRTFIHKTFANHTQVCNIFNCMFFMIFYALMLIFFKTWPHILGILIKFTPNYTNYIISTYGSGAGWQHKHLRNGVGLMQRLGFASKTTLWWMRCVVWI